MDHHFSDKKLFSRDTINELKRDKIVVLTTHSMEEADALGDKIAMMSQGRLRAIGSSVYLKAKYGAGE